MKGNFHSQKGLTLVEVLVSIVILSIILMTTMSFFPQMGFINKQNEDKTKAVNTAKEILIDWKGSDKVKNFLINKQPESDFLPNTVNENVYYISYDFSDSTYYNFKTTRNNYNVNIKIKKTTAKASDASSIHLIVVQILNTKGKPMSETYGYIKKRGR
ncbi:prepilin-type N-terminal cleavage/methylation domain-containing protein [Bacillus sp. FJAT-29953]|nr:prepilin-type N-terminal cleavage/methylation domain-containing protein [Bacillus sp. FJAT-29953]